MWSAPLQLFAAVSSSNSPPTVQFDLVSEDRNGAAHALGNEASEHEAYSPA
jgi:hypothetical protein